MKNLFIRLGILFLGILILGISLWAGLVVWFTKPVEAQALRLVLVLGIIFFGLIGVTGCFYRRFTYLSPAAIVIIAVAFWWSGMEPSNHRQWQRDVSVLARAEINGPLVTVRNIRDFTYRTETDYTPRWHDETFDLRKLDSLDLIAVYWMGDGIAHIFASFGFGKDRIAFSIETRKEVNETYSTLAGFFRQYELYFVVADERDLIGLRTTHRRPPEDVYIYRVFAEKTGIRKLFMQYITEINDLNERPVFYNTLFTNCTTKIVSQVRAFSDRMPISWKIILSGYFPELVYEMGMLESTLPYAELRARSHINPAARAADGQEEFSRLIRKGLPGM